MAPSGGAKKNSKGVHNYKSSPIKIPQNIFKNCRDSISVSTKNGTAFRFWHYLYELDSFLWHPVTK